MERRQIKIYYILCVVIAISLIASICEVAKSNALSEEVTATTKVAVTETTTKKETSKKVETTTKKTIKKAKKKTTKKAKKTTTTKESTTEWTGPKLNSVNGRIEGPSGTETFYNLDMSNCIENIRALGYKGDVWVRDDGCKMFGKYIMVAANLKIRPYGTIVQTSLGEGIVVDTGEFALTNPYQLDLAVTWVV